MSNIRKIKNYKEIIWLIINKLDIFFYKIFDTYKKNFVSLHRIKQ